MTTYKTITFISPDDWHLHLRDRDSGILGAVGLATANIFPRALIMPNLTPPITGVSQANAYRERILAVTHSKFNPMMTLYLTDTTQISDIIEMKQLDYMLAVKYYPAGATTNSDAGITHLKNVYPQLEKMEELQIPLCMHGEITSGDIFDRESIFVEEILIALRKDFPELPIVLEHITTKEAVNYVQHAEGKIAATITPQHLHFNRNDFLVGGVKPHLYCLPILKTEDDRLALISAATSGNPKFFLGTDSAPHTKGSKESSCGCAGCFSAGYALQMYASVFDKENALHTFEAFCSKNGADFYGLPYNTGTITLQKKEMTVPNEVSFHDNTGKKQTLIPLMAGKRLDWSIQNKYKGEIQ